MPNNTIEFVSKKAGIEKSKVEDLWNAAKVLAKKEYPGKGEDFQIIMGIFKKSLGQDVIKKLGWEESKLSEQKLPSLQDFFVSFQEDDFSKYGK